MILAIGSPCNHGQNLGENLCKKPL